MERGLKTGPIAGAEPVAGTRGDINVRLPTPDHDLFLLGYGISFPEHLTLQTIEILHRCSKIFTNLSAGEIDLAPPEIREKMICVWSWYVEGRARVVNYDDIAREILNAATAEHPVGWLTMGHPTVFDSVSQMLIVGADELRLSLEIIPAVSSIDTVLAQLGFEPAHGLQLHDATALCAASVPLDRHRALLLMQPSSFGSERTSYASMTVPDFAALQTYLLRTYPSGHPCCFVRSFSAQSGPDSIAWFPIGGLDQADFEAIAASCLFVPPVPYDDAPA
jgi:uncharacterized protein YabN with tetrapyrrole methylase and pyrophosphatase domain